MKALLAWSTGKDSAWALQALRAGGDLEVVGLLTTINAVAGRVAMHGVREELLDRQAAALGLPVVRLPIPSPCSNDEYDAVMRAAMDRARGDGIEGVAFGDLFLEDVRRYREERLRPTGIVPVFPLWGRPTAALARDMVEAGVRAIVTCVDSRRLDASFAGRTFDAALLPELEAAGADPCGENGEFHTFVFAGPMFPSPLDVEPGSIVEREGFVFADLRAGAAPPDAVPAWIPPEVRGQLDVSELETQDDLALGERDRLERLLGHHVAVYRRGAKGRPGGLCDLYTAADLSAHQRAAVEEAEAAFPDAVFVAYARPLRRR